MRVQVGQHILSKGASARARACRLVKRARGARDTSRAKRRLQDILLYKKTSHVQYGPDQDPAWQGYMKTSASNQPQTKAMGSAVRLAMLVNNPCLNDARVLRAASVATEAGYDTIVLARGTGAEREDEVVEGFQVQRLTEPGLARRKTRLSDGLRKANLWFFQTALETRALKALFEPTLTRLKPDLIHAHDLATLPAGAAAAAKTGALLIYDAHELEAHRMTRAGPIDTWQRRRIEEAYVGRADAIITVSDSIARHLADAYAVPVPTVIMNAPDQAEAKTGAGDLRADLDLSTDVPLAVYLGKLTRGRGLEQTIAALRHWPELHLALVGPEHPPTVRALRSLVGRLDLNKRVHIVSPVLPEHVTYYVSSADFSIVPIQNACLSYFYSLPNKLLESTFARLPLAVSDFPEFRRFLALSHSGIVMDESDPLDIARAAREVYERRDALRPSEETLREVEAIYGWQRQKQVLMDLYRSLAQRLHRK